MPEKFAGKSAEDIARAYVELERQRGGAAPPAPPQAPPAGAPHRGGLIPEPAAADLVERFAPYAQEYAQTGQLSERSMAALEAQERIPRVLALDYLQAIAARGELTVRAAHERVGGKDAFNAMATWASTNLSAAERQHFNAASNGDPETFALLVDGVAARWRAAVGSSPQSQVLGDLPAGAGAVPYASEDEYQRDVQTKEYRTDPAFRQKVFARLQNSRWLAEKAATVPGWNTEPRGPGPF